MRNWITLLAAIAALALFGWADDAHYGKTFCFGNGDDFTCPCGNFSTGFGGCANSTGVGAVLQDDGSASLSAGDLTFEVQGVVPARSALLTCGRNRINGGHGWPFGDGLRCVGGGVVRIGLRVSDAEGQVSWDAESVQMASLTAGDTRYFQVWYRDSEVEPCGTGFNFSNGVEITYGP